MRLQADTCLLQEKKNLRILRKPLLPFVPFVARRQLREVQLTTLSSLFHSETTQRLPAAAMVSSSVPLSVDHKTFVPAR